MPGRACDRAFTLAELVMAISITAIIGLAVAGMATALTHAHSRSDTMRESVQSARVGMMKVDERVRKAKLVTATGSGRLVVWRGDANEDKQINVDELVLVKYDANEGTLAYWQVVFPDSMSPGVRDALNVTQTLEQVTDGRKVERLLGKSRYANYLSQPVLATNVTGFTVGTVPAAPTTRLVTLQLAVGPVDQHITLSNAVQLRADATEYAEQVRGKWVLNLP